MFKLGNKTIKVIAALAIMASTSVSTVAASAATIGTSWSNATVTSGSAGLNAIAFHDGVFVGGNFAGDVLRSTDGKSWTRVVDDAQGDFNNIEWTAAAYGSGKFVLLGFENAQTWLTYSSDAGATFSTPVSIFFSYRFTGLAYGNGKFVATDSEEEDGFTTYSENGVEWFTGGAIDNEEAQASVTFGKGVFVSVSEDGSIAYTADPTADWTAANYTAPGFGRFSQVYFNGSKFLSIYLDSSDRDAYKTYAFTSSDGINWSNALTTGGINGSRDWSIGWDGGAWLAGAGIIPADTLQRGTGIYRSKDGINWKKVDDNNTQWRAFALGDGIVVAGGTPQASTTTGLNAVQAIGWSEGPLSSDTLADTGASNYSVAGLFLLLAGAILILTIKRRETSN